MLATMTTHRSIGEALADLLQFRRGSSAFVVNAAGDLEHQATVVTERLRPGESVPQCVERMRASGALRPGDLVEVLNNDNKLDTIRITRQAR